MDPIIPLLQGRDDIHRQLALLFYRLMSTLGINLSVLSDLARVRAPHMRGFLQGRNDLPVATLYTLSDALNVSPEALIKFDFDIQTAHHHVRGKQPKVPDKYLEEAQSKVLTILNILRYVDAHFPPQFKVSLLSSLQLTESMFTDPGALVNQRMAIDLVSKIIDRSNDPSIAFQIGMQSAKTIRALGINNQFSDIKSQIGVFHRIISEKAVQSLIEKNRSWKIVRERSGVLFVRATISESTIKAFEDHYLHNRYAEMIRMGYLASMPMYAGLAPVKVFIHSLSSADARESHFFIKTMSA